MPRLPGPRRRGGGTLAAAVVAALACALSLVAVPGAGARRSPVPGACPGSNLRPTRANVRVVEAATLCLVNRMRAASQLVVLRANRKLTWVAGSKVGSMVSGDYFADVGPSGRTPMSLLRSARYAAVTAVGQNIAWGMGAGATPAGVVQAWMASPPHRELLLGGSYREAGVGVTAAVPAIVHAGGHGATYVIELGARR